MDKSVRLINIFLHPIYNPFFEIGHFVEINHERPEKSQGRDGGHGFCCQSPRGVL